MMAGLLRAALPTFMTSCTGPGLPDVGAIGGVVACLALIIAGVVADKRKVKRRRARP